MKKNTLNSLLRRLSALTLAAALALPTAYASAGETKLQTTQTLVDGLDYINTITYHPESGRTESFTLELSPDSKAWPIMIQGSNTIYSGASINKAIEHAREKGHHVLGAINTDFFSYATGVPMGIVIEDGIYKSSPEDRAALTITDGTFGLLQAPQILITLTNEENNQETTLTHLNKWRAGTGGLYLLNEYYSTVSTRTSTSGWMVRLEEVNPEDELTVSSEITLEVTELIQGSEAVTIGENNYILTADDQSNLLPVYQSFQVGDRVTLTTQCDAPELEDSQWACGVGDVMVQDGKLTDSTQWEYIKNGRDPRTALGVRDDGTVVMYVVDGRSSGYSNGLKQVDLANEMLEQGCKWAVNLDGGGSSAMSVWVPGRNTSSAIVNRPSDGKPRSCATYLLLVSEDDGTRRPDRLALKEDGLVVLAGSSVDLGQAVVLDRALNRLDETADDVTIRSENDLGELDGTIYTAGNRAGTDTLTLRSKDLGIRGTAQIHVVDSLTELTLTLGNTAEPMTGLSLKPGDQVDLNAVGSYYSRPALHGKLGVTWTVDSGVGTVDENGIFTAALNGSLSGTITATAGSLTQTIPVVLTNVHLDVPESHWAHTAVDYCYRNQLVSGISSSQYGPTMNIRRGDFLLMLYRAAGSPAVSTTVNFPDVAPTDYYATAIAWAQENGLASGMADGTFAPKTNVTREQAFTMLNRALPLMGIYCERIPTLVLDQFRDLNNMSSWAMEHAATLVAYQIVGGSGGAINPKGNLTRAEMAVLLYKIGNFDSSKKPVLPEVDPSVVLGVVLEQNDITLNAGDSIQLSASLYPETAEGGIRWTASSSVPNVACVSPDGTVTNLNTTGQTVNLTVNASAGTTYDSCIVRCLPAEHSGKVVEDATALNVRSGPSTDHEVLDRISKGMGVIILESLDNGWLHIQYLSSAGTAASGYVSSDYITPN